MSEIQTVEAFIESFPEFIRKNLSVAWQKLESACQNDAKAGSAGQIPGTDAFKRDLITLWSRSDFVKESCVRCPEIVARWASESSPLYTSKSEQSFFDELRIKVGAVETEAQLMQTLRQYRREEMARLMARDVLNLAKLQETLADVTALADASVVVALNWLYVMLVEKYGRPMSRAKEGKPSEPQYMLVMAMGKHGAKELNVSSDIDLIFAYPESGVTDHPDKPIENQLFFIRLGQKLIQVLDQMTADGFVFRVDMRLRPYGDSGALALNFSAFEDYYYTQGREWERFAMIKARIVNAHEHEAAAAKLMKLIRPFVYRKYADFSSIQALRDMKRLIMSEVHRKGGDQNIKLGRGGIREIEFIAQACQLIYGGRDISLQQTGLMPMYQLLKENNYLPADWVDGLLESYMFLRNLEHAIQSLADQQTQLIPSTEEGRERVAWSMGFDTWVNLAAVLDVHREQVNRYFEDFLCDPEEAADNLVTRNGPDILSLWRAGAESDEWLAAFTELGFDAPESSFEGLQSLREHRLFSLMSNEARQRFETFLPVFLQFVGQTKVPSKTLDRMLGLVRAIMGRTVYFVLLYENLEALKQLCHLCAESPWVSEHIAKSPVILDELLDPRTLFQPPKKAELIDELRQQLLRIPEDDLEAQMNCLRTFKQSHMLRVAASELAGHLPLMKVSDYLTWLAEAILSQSVNIAWRNLVAKHGVPSGGAVVEDDAAFSGKGFAIIGYGKLGGIELGYGSDLDMVFLYDADDYSMTNGDKSINNQTFYMRLGQRIIHILSAQTTQGNCYETDMRLRPSGNSGMLVSSIQAFEKYQQQDAWTWEHQALVRARAIVGDPALIAKFDEVRRSILSQNRDREKLRQEVKEMREKMKANAKRMDIKQGNGGLIDIEFISQYGVLAFSSEHPSLLEWTDNIRILESLAKVDCFKGLALEPLISAYRELRSALHKNSLAEDDDKAVIEDFPGITSMVEAVWKRIFEPDDNVQ
jgi:glutamate-ammonia-ligase adenylyltransferase